MATKAAREKNNRRKRLTAKYRARRTTLKKVISNRSLPLEERFQATLKLATLPRNGSRVRIKNRCQITGRPRGYYRKFKMSRIAIRDLFSEGLIPGVIKSSW